MKRKLVSALAAMAISGCGSEPVALGNLPPVADAANAGEVAVVRARGFIGEGFDYYININQINVFALGAGEHTRFRLPAGEHRVAIRCYSAWTAGWNEAAVTVRIAAGQTTYLAVAPKFECATVDPVPEREGKKLVSTTTFKPL